MMDLWHSLSGMVQLQLTSADPAGTLTALNSANIPIYGVEPGDDAMSVRFKIHRQDGRMLRKIVDKRGDSVCQRGGTGLYWPMIGMLRRPVLLLGIVMILFLTLYLPTRVFFFEIDGNVSVPTRLILEKAEECGIYFGASRREVRSEKVKNALLAAIPELQWAGVNTVGCVATITVRERTAEEKTLPVSGVSSIVALRDGVITVCTVTKGSAACQVGQSVTAGQVLISGYTDCGSTLRAEEAQGEVFGETERSLEAICPSEWSSKTSCGQEILKYALIFGKKRINFYKGSGILDTTCDKMYVENYLTLPGGFQLPIGIATEVWQFRGTEAAELEESSAEDCLESFAEEYLSGQMIAGQIRNASEMINLDWGVYKLTGFYTCEEMIGISRKEETIKPNGEHD